MADLLAALERIAAHDVGRGSARLLAHSAGRLPAAARSLLATPSPRVVIITGFFIPAATPPACETDGPIGAVQTAAALRTLGGAVRILTDAPCEPVVATAAAAAGLDIPIDVAPLPRAMGQPGYEAWQAEALERYRAVTHMISIERVGPGEDGLPRNLRGQDISAHTAPLERIYLGGPWFTVGIGDGGNELGMGSLPSDAVADAVPGGERIRCTVPCDALIVAGTSNWGAAALVAALFHLTRSTGLLELLRIEWSQQILTDIVEHAGAVDGILRRPAATVDGLSWDEYRQPLSSLLRLARHPVAQVRAVGHGYGEGGSGG